MATIDVVAQGSTSIIGVGPIPDFYGGGSKTVQISQDISTGLSDTVTFSSPMSPRLHANVRQLWQQRLVTLFVDAILVTDDSVIDTYGPFGSGSTGAFTTTVAADSPVIEAIGDDSFTAGQIGYVKLTGNIGLANTTISSNALGIAIEDSTAPANSKLQTEGAITLADWTVATGSSTLTPGAMYYLTSGGQMTTTLPAPSAGESIIIIGNALSSLILDAHITNIGTFL